MDKLTLDFGKRSYDIVFSDSFADLSGELINACGKSKILVVTDSNVDKLYSGQILALLSGAGFTARKFVFDAGEQSKNIDVLQQIYTACLTHSLDRGSVIAALGGGVAGDMAGFAAATFMRGIRFVQIPTTLLAQTDSSVGGKVGIDYGGVKNIVGAFKQPSLVHINASTLGTLPYREFAAGLAEVIKYGIIYDKVFFEYLEGHICKVKALDTNIMHHILRRCCKIKADVVMQDETEQGLRAILNFGHTIGHGIESAMDFKLLHGECVAIGMVGACKIAAGRGYLSEPDLDRILSIIKAFDLPVKANGINKADILHYMHSDKKKGSDGLKFILPKAIGTVEPFTDLTEQEINTGIDFILNG